MLSVFVAFCVAAGPATPPAPSGGAVPPPVISSKDRVLLVTPNWTGPRSEDGRPMVSEELLKRMKNVSIVQAWEFVRSNGYANCYENGQGWNIIHPDQAIIGRVLTAQYMPTHPDFNAAITRQGQAEGRIGGSNSWPIDMLKKGDVYVADGMGKVENGTLIGDNLGNSIFAKSGNGVIFDAGVRDLEGLEDIKGFNAWHKGAHPSAISQVMLTGINLPIRIGKAIACPGDIVIAKPEGIVFVPPHLVESLVITAEQTMLKDLFGHQRLIEGKYTPGQIDRGWSAEITADYVEWLKANIDKLPVPKEVTQGVIDAGGNPARRGPARGARGGGRGGAGGGGGGEQ
jgi:regulator of RNase E activity RraA